MVLKKQDPPEPNFKVPQTDGISGWIVLSHENNIPVCSWISIRECTSLKICLDERLFGDTIFRVEKIGKLDYIISDIWMYNSSCIFMASTFKQRYDWLKDILKRFFKKVDGFVNLIHKSEIKETSLRGYEVYSNVRGERGSFVEPELTILKTQIPDVYNIKDKTGILIVPDLKTSLFLRSKGETFKLKCKQVEDDWEILENIPDIQ